MKSKLRISVIVLSVIAILTLTGCTTNTPTENIEIKTSQNTESTLVDLNDITAHTPPKISETFEQDSKILAIDADVDLHNVENLYVVTLIRDEESAERMAKVLVTSKYENVSEQSSWNWSVIQKDAVVVSFDLNKYWIANYIDVANNHDGRYHDEEYYTKYGYITKVVPRQMDLTADEACDAVRAYFKNYTEFTFLPYRVFAADSSTDSTQPGYYTVWMQAAYDNIPICIKSDQGLIGVTAHISKTEVFGFQGLFLLKPSSQKSISKIVPLETIIAQFKNNFTLLSSSPRINIDHISLEYVSQKNTDDSYNLRPVWSFYGEVPNETDESITSWILSYFADNGTLYDCGDLYSVKGVPVS